MEDTDSFGDHDGLNLGLHLERHGRNIGFEWLFGRDSIRACVRHRVRFVTLGHTTHSLRLSSI